MAGSQGVGPGGGAHSDLGVIITQQDRWQHAAGAYADSSSEAHASTSASRHPGWADSPSSQVRRLKLRVAECWAGGADSSGVGLKVSEQRPWVLAIAWPGEEGRETEGRAGLCPGPTVSTLWARSVSIRARCLCWAAVLRSTPT